ncbi:unnamed protein product [Trichogramma brassicae]|uniref:RING-type E3 ubiquitin transferase n=1 Tax=Trichogramma brassicae TaxID=86971 RepID=A0A6H5J4J7_9HYME|nr:unnamed protein product [Trichogramma brassicae]
MIAEYGLWRARRGKHARDLRAVVQREKSARSLGTGREKGLCSGTYVHCCISCIRRREMIVAQLGRVRGRAHTQNRADKRHATYATQMRGTSADLCNVICRRGNAELLESLFKTDARVTRLVRVDVQNESSRTPIQISVSSLMPHVLDVIMNHVPFESRFIIQLEHILEPELHEAGYFKLRLASGALAMVEQIWRRSYDFDQSKAVMIMKFFGEHQLFEKSNANDSYDDENITRGALYTISIVGARAKRCTIGSRLSRV